MCAPPTRRALHRVSGVVQTGLYCDFFVNYYRAKQQGLNKAVPLQPDEQC
jgi:hypothetical protein